ncbi:MAG: CBS domain-containing protein [Patescibacteria group bacterium]|nr:CBS domain-containing protein [Patescibacteria group bacterium]
MRIKNIMAKKVIFVLPDTNISETAKLMEKHRIHGIPVVDKKQVVGIITETDFFVRDSYNFHLPSYINFVKDSEANNYIKDDSKKKIKIEKFLNIKAKDIMAKKCVTVDADMEIKKLLQIIKKTKLQIFPVVNKNKILVGIVALPDIIKLLKI